MKPWASTPPRLLRSERQQVLAANIANADTPGHKGG